MNQVIFLFIIKFIKQLDGTATNNPVSTFMTNSTMNDLLRDNRKSLYFEIEFNKIDVDDTFLTVLENKLMSWLTTLFRTIPN